MPPTLVPESPSRSAIACNAEWFPHAMDVAHDRVLMVKRSPEEFRAASFLDNRELRPDSERIVVSWDDLARSIPADARRDVQYIFHISHVGSTLLSRLLGETEGIFSLREPMILRTFHEVSALLDRPESPWAPERFPERLDILTALLSRTFETHSRALVKATSFTSDLAPQLLRPASRALLLYTSPERFLANLMAGDGARSDLYNLAGFRLSRLSRIFEDVPWRLWKMSEGEKAAMSWLCEINALAAAARALSPEHVQWLDIDTFLEEPSVHLVRVSAFFGCRTDAKHAEAICSGPLMSRYAKDPEHPYTPKLREEVLASSAATNRREIARGMSWLAGAASRYPQAAACLETARDN